MANVTEMPPAEATETVDTPPESPKTIKTSTSKKAGRPPAGPEPKFFDKVGAVPKSDWGTRAFMYVYADEPVCNAKTFGTTRYMLKSSAPILDLEGLKQDYGSFKGWMTLNLRKTGKDQTDEVDRYEFEIYDPKHPPKIPRSAWANDARNKKWLDLLPPEKPQPSDGAATMLDAMKVYKEIRNEVKDEIPVQPEQTDPTRSTLETMKLAKELFAPASNGAEPAKDPLQIAVALATTMMQMKADNPMVDFLREQMRQQHEEMMQMRKDLQDREKEREKAPAAKGLFEQLMDFGGDAIKTKIVASLFGGTAAAATDAAPVRAGRMNTLEFISDFGPKALQVFAPLVDAAAHKMMNPTNGNGANGNGAGPAIQTQQVRSADPFQRFIRDVVNETMLTYFNADPSGEGGEGYADWIYAGYPQYLAQLQNFEHGAMPGMKGAAAIITGYKNTPQIWNQIGPQREVQFVEFVNGFCAWKPEPEEDAIDVETVPAGGMEEGYEEEERVS